MCQAQSIDSAEHRDSLKRAMARLLLIVDQDVVHVRRTMAARAASCSVCRSASCSVIIRWQFARQVLVAGSPAPGGTDR